MKKLSWLWQVLTVAIVVSACTLNEDVTLSDPSLETATIADIGSGGLIPTTCASQSWTLWAGQTINAGSLTVSNDNDNLYVTYTASGSNTFGTLHLWVGTDLSLVPAVGNGPNAGTPIPGQFPYHHDATGTNSYTYTLPLASLPGWTGVCDSNGNGTSFYVVAHAEMNVAQEDGTFNGETAFGGNLPGSSNRWWFYASYTTKCCVAPPPPPSVKYGTAFAKGGWVFTTDKKSNPEKLPSLNLTKNRWGWVINITTAGTTTYDIWNGAGLNNISKAKKVGTATVVFNGSQVAVTYNYLSGFSFEESHVYAGDFRPTTIAPGQYGYTEYYNPTATTDTYTFDVSDTDGDGIWLILHAVAYGPSLTNP